MAKGDTKKLNKIIQILIKWEKYTEKYQKKRKKI